MDDKTKFLLKLKGKEDCGFLEFWAIAYDDLAGIMEGETADDAEYVLGGRDGVYEIYDDYAVGNNKFYKLGEKVTHRKLIEILAGAVPGKYYDPNYKNYLADGK